MNKITLKEFEAHYITEYALLEQEFCDTLPYLTLDPDNQRAFSHAYIKILLQTGSMVDNFLKLFFLLLRPDFDNNMKEKSRKNEKKHLDINDYRKYIAEYSLKTNEPKFYEQEILVKENEIIIKPWGNWEKCNSPLWWKAYNKVKHDRFAEGVIDNTKQEKRKYYKFANQKYTLLALGGLYQLCNNIYRYLLKQSGENIDVIEKNGEFQLVRPIKSKIFELPDWNMKLLFQDIIIEDELIQKGYIDPPPDLTNIANAPKN